MKNWWRSKFSFTGNASTSASSQEWVALAGAVASRDFKVLPGCMRAWCVMEERDLDRLLKVAEQAHYTPAEVSKLRVFFYHFCNDGVTAFDQARKSMVAHGFDPDLHIIGLVCLFQNNQFDDALVYLQELSDEQTSGIQRADYWHMVSLIFWANNVMGRLALAINRAVELAPDDEVVLQLALAIHIELGNQAKIDQIRAILETMPKAKEYTYALCMLTLGELETGWQYMETRYEMAEVSRYINVSLNAHPRWKGEELTGLRLLVSAEQGLGDTIQMARYLSLLQSQVTKELLLEIQSEALTLLQFNFPNIPMVERQWLKDPKVKFDRWIGMMSLPYHLKLWGKDTPGRSGYLRVPPDVAAYWQSRVEQLNSSELPKIGLAWSGQPAHRADRRRSIPFDLMMSQVRSVNATFFALQTKVPDLMPANVINVTEEMITLADTAALIEQMDLVITVDTSIVHIAGALAKETWLLLPKRYEWRWGLEGEGNDWYDSVKVLRQTEHANWLPVLQDVFKRRLPTKFDM